MTFPAEITIAHAMVHVQNYLSRPASREYYDKIKDDLLHRTLERYLLASGGMPPRGDFLGDCWFLERVTIEGDYATLKCGS